MDLTTIIVAIVTGVFSLFTIILQKKNTKEANNLEEKSKIIQRKNDLASEINKLKDDANILYQTRNQLILETNINVLKRDDINGDQLKNIDEKAERITSEIKRIHEKIEEKRNEFYTLEKVDKYIKDNNSG